MQCQQFQSQHHLLDKLDHLAVPIHFLFQQVVDLDQELFLSLQDHCLQG
jgi:hypothetical protein